ncbi:MAG: hypothetical protein Q9170_004984, partial [Blastenia crenularia]
MSSTCCELLVRLHNSSKHHARMLNKGAHGFKRILIKPPPPGAKASDDKPRAAPARPKPLDFPHYQVQGDLDAVHEYAQDFSHLFVDLEKNVSRKIIETLNIQPLGEVPLDRLIPGEYLPPQEWLQDPSTFTTTDEPAEKLSNGTPKPTHKDFYARARELHRPTDEAFRSISNPRSSPRNPNASPPLRLSHTHKFYQHLLLMAEYWDTSKDNYIPPPPSTAVTNDGGKKELYTGRRYGVPGEMAPSYREDTVSAFLELVLWPHRCTLQSPRSSVGRKLFFQNSRYLPIQGVTSTVCRVSSDRQQARKGIIE